MNEKKILDKNPNFIEKFCLKNNFFKKKIIRRLKRKNNRNTNNLLNKQDFDVFIPTYYNTYFLEFIGKKPYVLTVYDMIHELFPMYFLEDKFTSSNKKILIEKANKIIAISESTKKDILKFYPSINPSIIEVVYLSQSINYDNSLELNLPKNYILFVGNRTIYKNFDFFFEAVSSYLKENPDLYLVCAGGRAFSNDENIMINKYALQDQVKQYDFKDYELGTYYKNAKCFIFPSLYEGFGIPVLESMFCGCPVILSNHSSFPEVAGDAGIYYEKDNKDDLLAKIKLVIENSEYRNEIIQKGIAQEKKFSWEKTAKECFRVYKSVL